VRPTYFHGMVLTTNIFIPCISVSHTTADGGKLTHGQTTPDEPITAALHGPPLSARRQSMRAMRRVFARPRVDRADIPC
jgi:hypothetical protein